MLATAFSTADRSHGRNTGFPGKQLPVAVPSVARSMSQRRQTKDPVSQFGAPPLAHGTAKAIQVNVTPTARRATPP